MADILISSTKRFHIYAKPERENGNQCLSNARINGVPNVFILKYSIRIYSTNMPSEEQCNGQQQQQQKMPNREKQPHNECKMLECVVCLWCS